MRQDVPAQKAMPDLALVLAGGFGTRLRSVLAGRPKSLAPAAGRTFLHYVLEYLKRQGVQRVVLCVGHLADQVQAYAGDGGDWGLEITYSIEQSALGTGGALRQACAGLDQPFFALNGDTLFQVDLSALWEQHVRLGCLATVALLPVSDASSRGRVRLAQDGRILSFDEKPAPGEPVETSRWDVSNNQMPGENQTPQRGVSTNIVNGGVYLLEPLALADIPPWEAASIEREVFPRLASRGQLGGLVQDAYFADIGTPESLEAFERDVVRGVV